MLFNEEQILIRDSIREFVREQILPHAADWDRDHHFPREQLQQLADLGLYGMFVPEEWCAVDHTERQQLGRLRGVAILRQRLAERDFFETARFG